MRNDFFPTLSAVREEIDFRLKMAFAELVQDDFFTSAHNAFSTGVAYGQQVQAHAPLALLRGKKTGKWAHAVVERMETGTYELTFYIL